HRLNHLGRPRLIAQHAAELPHGHGEHGLTDDGVGPDRGQQRVFGHELARPGHQADKDRKGFWGQMDHLRTAPQAFVPEVELKRAKHEALGLWHTSPLPRPPHRDTAPPSDNLQNFFRNSSPFLQDWGPGLTLYFRRRLCVAHLYALARTGV